MSLKIVFAIIAFLLAVPPEKKSSDKTDKKIKSSVVKDKPDLKGIKLKTIKNEKLKKEPKDQAFLEFEKAYQRYIEIYKEYSREIGLLINSEINAKKKEIETSYAQVIRVLEKKEQEKRLNAIRLFEEFIRKYPDHPIYTPDAMFRLAELYYENSEITYNWEEEKYEKDLELYNRGKIPKMPKAPVLDYSNSIRIYKKLISKFPGYRYIDAAYYLLGYCYINMDKDYEAIKVYNELVRKFPNSQFVTEVYMRIGELHFDLGEYKEAIKAYSKVLERGDYYIDKNGKKVKNKFYELAFYKLAWSYFQDYQFKKAINKFIALLDYYEKRKRESASETAMSLKKEVIEYIGKTLADDDWDYNGEKDPDAGVKRGLSFLKGNASYIKDILKVYGDALYNLHEKSKYLEAIQVYKELLRRYPNDPDNPEIQQRIVTIYDTLQDIKGALEARKELVEKYGKNSDWYKANAQNPGAILKADQLVEKAALKRALIIHRDAQETKMEAQAKNSPELFEKAKKLYIEAAAAYKQYLKEYPDTPQKYDILFYLAETLFYSDQYLQAAYYYEKVRDFKGRTDYLEYAAYSAIISYQKYIDYLVKNNKLPSWMALEEIKEVKSVEGEKVKEKVKGKIKRVKAKKMPEIFKKYISAIDEYVKRGLTRKDDPEMQAKLAYKAAELFLKFKDYKEARRRFAEIIDKYPKSIIANYAAANIINSYWEENDIENVKKWAQIIKEKKIGKPEELKKWQAQIKTFEMGAQFEHAMKLLKEKKYVQAAREFVDLVDKNPDFEDADKALINAALAFQDAGYYEEAAKTFQRIVLEPRFKKSKYREKALFFLSENYKKFFNFSKAIWGYKLYYDLYPNSENAPYALLQAAQLLEFNQQYEEAISYYKEYTRKFPNKDNAGKVYYKVVTLTKKLGNDRQYEKELLTFIKRYYKDPSVSDKIVKSYLDLAKLYLKQGKERKAKKYFKTVIEEYKKRGFQPGSVPASYAACAMFNIVEFKFRKYKSIKIKGSLVEQGKAIKAKQKMLPELEKEYADVFPFKSLDWTVAAYYRIGKIYQEFADSLYEAPVPKNLTEEQQDIFREQLDELSMKWLTVAIKRYEITLKNAKRFNVINKWTKKTLEELNKFKPQEYPLFKEVKEMFILE